MNVVIHVPSRMEVCRIVMDCIPVWDKDDIYDYIPRISSNCHNTISLCSTRLGFVMTGYNLRKTISSPPEMIVKKKLKRSATSTKKTKITKKDSQVV